MYAQKIQKEEDKFCQFLPQKVFDVDNKW